MRLYPGHSLQGKQNRCGTNPAGPSASPRRTRGRREEPGAAPHWAGLALPPARRQVSLRRRAAVCPAPQRSCGCLRHRQAGQGVVSLWCLELQELWQRLEQTSASFFLSFSFFFSFFFLRNIFILMSFPIFLQAFISFFIFFLSFCFPLQKSPGNTVKPPVETREEQESITTCLFTLCYQLKNTLECLQLDCFINIVLPHCKH